MYLGHLSPALAAKKWRPDLPLWVLLCAPVWVDFVQAGFAFLGRAEIAGQSPHMVPGAVVISLVVGVVAAAMYDAAAGLLLGALTLSHLLEDWVTSHMLVWPGGPALGLHLYGTRWLDFVVEAVFMVGGVLLYRQSLPAARRSAWPVWAMLGLMLGVQAVFDFGMQIGK